jgi:TrmH family RNA methyltransferase
VLAHKLLRQAKHREETGLFACEGEDLVSAAAASGIDPVELLVADENVAPKLLESVSTLPHPARVIGIYRRSELPSRPRDVTLGLWRLGDPGNVGTLVRTADAFGAGVALSHGCADPFGPKALRASAGAIFRVPLGSWAALPVRQVALVAHGEEPLLDADLTPPVAFLLGSERDGLPDDLVAACRKVTIPLTGQAESLNVAAAGAIVLYELARRSA